MRRCFICAVMTATTPTLTPLDRRRKELDAVQEDEAVKVLDELAERKEAAVEEVIDWHGGHVPVTQKAGLILGAVTMSASCWILFFGDCFHPFQVTDSIDEKFGGNWAAIVRGPGWFALALCLSAYGCLKRFQMWYEYSHLELLVDRTVKMQESKVAAAKKGITV